MERKETNQKERKQKRTRPVLPMSVSIGEIIKAKEEKERKEKER